MLEERKREQGKFGSEQVAEEERQGKSGPL